VGRLLGAKRRRFREHERKAGEEAVEEILGSDPIHRTAVERLSANFSDLSDNLPESSSEPPLKKSRLASKETAPEVSRKKIKAEEDEKQTQKAEQKIERAERKAKRNAEKEREKKKRKKAKVL